MVYFIDMEEDSVSLSELVNFSGKQLTADVAVDTHRYTLYGGAVGGGKLLTLDTKIPTPSGWKKNENIQPGDFVFHTSGYPVRVLGVSDIEEDDAYELTFSDETSIVAGARHLWHTMTENERRLADKRNPEYRARRRASRPSRSKGKRPDLVDWNKDNTPPTKDAPQGVVRTTQEIVDTLKVHNGLNHIIFQPLPLQLPEVDLLVAPYTLGAWLGDGTSASGGMTGIDEPIFDEIKKDGYEVTHSKKIEQNWSILGIKDLLQEIRVLNNKHIPTPYLRASYEQRLALLQGIMDTDGWAEKDGQCAITLKSKVLFDDVVELLRTFGIIVRTKEVQKTCTNSPTRAVGTYHSAVFMSRTPLFRLKRKLERQNLSPEKRYVEYRYISEAKYLGKKEMRCIQVDNDDGMYLAGEQFIPTHNSYFIRWKMIKLLIHWFNIYDFRGIEVGIFCEDYPTLKDRQLSKIVKEFPEWIGVLHDDHKAHGKCFILADEYGGGIIKFRNLDDASKYQSAEFAAIGVDELTKNPLEVFLDLKHRLRWPGIEDTRFFAGTNPGGLGHSWVRKLWLDRDFSEEELAEADEYIYVPAKAEDNPHLAHSYLKQLDTLPEDMRRALRDGDWDIFKGQFFPNWRRETHTYEPFAIPKEWKRIIGGDYGYAAPSAVYWAAISPDDVVYVYRELYKPGLTYEQLCKEIVAMTPDDEQIAYWVFDPAIWARSGASSTAMSGADIIEQTYRRLMKDSGKHSFLRLMKGNNDRILGAGVFRERLKSRLLANGETASGLQVSRVCTNAIREIPSLVYDKNRIEDCDTHGSDHGYDAIRYILNSNPQRSRTAEETEELEFRKKIKENRRKSSLAFSSRK